MAKKKVEEVVINIDHLQETQVSETQNELELSFNDPNRFIDMALLIEEFDSIVKDSDKWKKTVSSIIVNDENDVSGMKMARAARLAAKETRLKLTKNIKKKVDEVEASISDKKKIIADLKKIDNDFQNIWKPLEADLLDKEKTKERAEEEERLQTKRLGTERMALLIPYGQDNTFSEEQLGLLPQETFDKVLLRIEDKYKRDIEELEKARMQPQAIPPVEVVESFKNVGFEVVKDNPKIAIGSFESMANPQPAPQPTHAPFVNVLQTPSTPPPVIAVNVPQQEIKLSDREVLDKVIEMTRDTVRFMLQHPVKDNILLSVYKELFDDLADAGKNAVVKLQSIKGKRQ